MPTTITIDHKTTGGRNPYSISLSSSHGHPAGLNQVGPVVNDVASYRGTYRSRREALRDALDYIGSCTIVEHRDPMAGSITHSVQRSDYKPRKHDVVLARKTTRGEYIADA